MSKNSTDTVELQRIISSNGSAMSTSESLTHTDMSPMGPLYSTVPEAKTAHTNYHQMQKKSNSPPSYQAPGEGEVPNEYDVIPDKQQQSRRLMRSVSPVVVADNVLYGDQNAADQMKHKALTMERGEEFQNKYSGNTSRPLPSDSKDDDYMIKCKCQTFCFTIVLLVVFLVAVAALVLVLIIMLGVYSVCDCNASASPQELSTLNSSVKSLQSEIQTLKAELEALRSAAEVNITVVSSELTQLNDNLDVIRENVSAAANDVINQRITEDGTIIGLNFTVQLSDVRLYDGCVTSIETECTVPTGLMMDGSATCVTAGVPIRRDDTYILDALCVRSRDSMEQNPMLTLLDVFDSRNEISCLCYVVVPNHESESFDHPVTCGLQVTRCPKSLATPANIITTQTHF